MLDDSLLAWGVIALPTLFSLVIELIDKRIRDRSRAWKCGVIGFGVILSFLIWWQQTRERTKTDSNLRALKEQITQQEKDSDERYGDITKTVQGLYARIQSRPRVFPMAKYPTPDEIASAVDQRLNQRLPTPKPSLPEIPPPAKSDTVVAVPVVKQPAPCRGDRLNECDDEQLAKWGKPLVSNIEVIMNDYLADLKKLDDIKGGKLNWLREIAGVGDKDSKWLKEHDLAEKKAADNFRNCCAERALAYHKELVHRTGGKENTEVYDWVKALLNPEKSKEWKKARESGGTVSDVYFDLDLMQIHLDSAVIKRDLGLSK